MKLALKIIRYTLTAPSFLGWLFPILMFWAVKDYRFIGDGVLAATWRPWVLKPRRILAVLHWPFGRVITISGQLEHRTWWKFSTTLSRGMIFQPTAATRTIQHERVHVRQVEDLLLLSFLLSIVWAITVGHGFQSWRIHVMVWISGVLWQLPNFLMAVLRGKNIYRRASQEDHAYALTNIITEAEAGKSWEQIFDERNQKL